MKIVAGKRTQPLEYELSPLEKAIQGYEAKANEYFSKERLNPPRTAQEREKRRQEALRHLYSERKHLSTIGSVQEQVARYRDTARQARDMSTPEGVKAARMLGDEKHHPTDTLMRYLRADGRPRPSPHHSAHHIVSGKGRYPEMEESRSHIHLVGGIGINDPDNGAWMPRSRKYIPHWSNPKTAPHSRIHTRRYEEWVASRVLLGFDEHSVRTHLQVIGRQLETGTQPQDIITEKVFKAK